MGTIEASLPSMIALIVPGKDAFVERKFPSGN